MYGRKSARQNRCGFDSRWTNSYKLQFAAAHKKLPFPVGNSSFRFRYCPVSACQDLGFHHTREGAQHLQHFFQRGIDLHGIG